MSEQDPSTRLSYSGSLEPVFRAAVDAYDLGRLLSHSAIPYGYEDFNAMVITSEGRFVAKIFAGFRSEAHIERYEDMMTAVLEAGINHPHMYEVDGELVYKDSDTGLSMVIMDFVEGKTFYESKNVPNSEELDLVLAEAAKINQLDYQPPYLHDSWAIPNLRQTFDPIKSKVPKPDRRLVEEVLADIESADIGELPNCFVHGDLIKSNIIRGDDGSVYVLDFSVANSYPRIQELAVIIGNLLNEQEPKTPFDEVVGMVADRYVAAGGQLTPAEIKALPTYARGAYASELIGATREKVVNHNQTKENEYWLRLGRAGLRRSMISKKIIQS